MINDGAIFIFLYNILLLAHNWSIAMLIACPMNDHSRSLSTKSNLESWSKLFLYAVNGFFPLAFHYINTAKYSAFKLNSEIYAQGSVDAYVCVCMYVLSSCIRDHV